MSLSRHQSQAAKRPRPESTEPDPSHTSKRSRLVVGPLDGYSKLEQSTLQNAADILEIPIERLLAAKTTPTNSSRSEGFDSTVSSTDMQASSANTKDSGVIEDIDQSDDALQDQHNALPFALHLPTASERAKRRQASRGLAVNSWLNQCQPEQADRNSAAHQSQCEVSGFIDNALMEPLAWDDDIYNYNEELPLITFAEPPAEKQKQSSHYSALQTPNPTTSAADTAYPYNTILSQKIKKYRGSFTDPKQKHETSLTRKLGACIRCRLQRLCCVFNPAQPEGCCQTCIDAARAMIHWFPCVRYNITDARLVDHGTRPRPTWTLRWKKMAILEIDSWASKETKRITITQDVAGTKYDIEVRRFIPLPGDSLARKWITNGTEQSYECTPYGIASMKAAGRTLAEFIDRTLGDQVFYYVDESDGLLRKTYMMAYRYSIFAESLEERVLLHDVFRLWCGLRMESRSDRICGSETLGMAPKDYGNDCPNTGLILTSPVFSAQLEVVMTTLILTPAKENVLKRLRNLIEKKRRSSWFAIYLSLFILLHSCSLLTAADYKKAQKQGLEGQFFRPSLIEELHHGAKILLTYFHYVNKGGSVFSMDWSSADQLAWADFDAEQIQFMQETSEELKAKADLFKTVRQKHLVEDKYYFICQLYDPDWKP